MRNFGIKLLALFVAVIFWLAVVALNQNIKELPFFLDVQIFNLSKNLSLVGTLPQVALQIDASSDVITNLSTSDFSAFLDFTGLDAGKHTLSIQVSPKNPKVRVVKVLPAETEIFLEEIAEKEVQFILKVVGKPSQNFKADLPVTKSKSVHVSGPKSVVEKVVSAQVVATFHGDEIADTSFSLSPMVINEQGDSIPGLQFNPKTIEVTVPVYQIDRTKTVGIKAGLVGALGAPDAYISAIEIDPPFVTLVGEDQYLRSVSTVSTESIDLSTIKSSVTLTKALVIPQNVEMKEVPLVQVHLMIEKYAMKTGSGAGNTEFKVKN